MNMYSTQSMRNVSRSAPWAQQRQMRHFGLWLFSSVRMRSMERAALIFFALVNLLAWYQPASASSPQSNGTVAPRLVYLPIVSRMPPAEPASVTCQLNEQEANVAAKMSSDPQQRRKTMVCDPILVEVARARARDMATRNYFNHVTPEGTGPNYWVTQAGYALPSWYDHSRSANNLESIAAGYATADDAWNAWMGSSHHKTHLLALNSFYADQVNFGIAFVEVPGSTYT